ncbi:CopM family metallochaperone [Lichenifustis flavocetrariae]|uniref:DUF305 domain-containing protein n=1 Tax=Lichenifustis flavocetrariae TaxID=2949735 RepID=A0AA42CQX3_9HYPH|nr:DUF305 domain-containing protein [Lichenifustis flavocetrariae]MCW6511870.1 DUF305 domain-containing protein [Lichenifustis flavocetrariae]
MNNRFKIAVALAAVAAPAMAFAEDMKMDMNASGGTPAEKAFAASMQTMMKNMDVKPTGKTDKDFVTMMMPHHQGAIDMANVELQYGKDPMLRKMAGDIVKAQEQEIGEMKAWLAKNPK